MGLRGPHKNPGRTAQWDLPFRPVILKELTLACGITQQHFADTLAARLNRPISRASANLTINRGYIPATIADYQRTVEQMLLAYKDGKCRQWLAARGLTITDIWTPASDDLRRKLPAGHRERTRTGTLIGMQKTRTALVPGDPDSINEEEKQMRKARIPEEVLKYFHLFRDPFVDDPRSEKEVFRSADHRYLEYAMYDAAINSGLIAIIAEVGAGKTVMRREVIERLRSDEKVRIVYPQIIDKTRIGAGSICDAIIMDLSNERPKMKLEDKSRQVRRLLSERVAQGKQVCLIIEEAHQLTVPALKYLKIFHELEEGRRKLLSIILLGQTELGLLLDEEQYPELRELSRRIQVATIPGLGDDTYAYLKLKYSIVGGDIGRIMDEDAAKALVSRLTAIDPATQKRYSQAYPLTVNNYMAKAMITAKELGYERITAEVIDAI